MEDLQCTSVRKPSVVVATWKTILVRQQAELCPFHPGSIHLCTAERGFDVLFVFESVDNSLCCDGRCLLEQIAICGRFHPKGN